MAHSSEGNDGIIEIKVKTTDSKTHDLRISNQRRARDLKEEIARLIELPAEQQYLIYCGKILKDNEVISSCNVQDGDALHLASSVPGLSSNGSSSSHPGASHIQDIPAVSNGISLDTQPEITNALETLLRYFHRMTLEYARTENNMNEVLGGVFDPSDPSQGIPEGAQLARLLSSTRDTLINRTSQLFLDFEGDLRQNLNVDDPSVRLRTVETIRMMFENVGRYFLQLQYHLNLDELHHNNSATSLRQTGSSFSVEDLTASFENMPSQRQHEQAIANIRQQNNTELAGVQGEENNINSLSPSRDDLFPMVISMLMKLLHLE